jgi:hypothetical protein
MQESICDLLGIALNEVLGEPNGLCIMVAFPHDTLGIGELKLPALIG